MEIPKGVRATIAVASSSHDSCSATTNVTQTLQHIDAPTGPSRHVEHKDYAQ